MMIHHSEEFKMRVVEHYKKSGSYYVTGKHFGICHATVTNWCKRLKKTGRTFNVDEFPCWITGGKHDLQVGTKRKLIA